MEEIIVDVCVIGAGIGGLAIAILLQKLNINVKVFERDYALDGRKQGYGMTLTNSRDGPLAKLGILDDCIAMNCFSTAHYIFTNDGFILGYYGRALSADRVRNLPNGGNRGNLRIPRQDLREMLISKLPFGYVVWDQKLSGIEESDTAVVCTFENISGISRKVVAKVVIGCDGFNSSVRSLIDSINRPLYLGVAVIIGLSTTSSFLTYHRGFYVIDGQQRLFTMPFRHNGNAENVVMWQLSFSCPTEEEALKLKNMSCLELHAAALNRVRGWFSDAVKLVEGALVEETWGTPLYDREPMSLKPKHFRSRVTVLGDACHPMSMFKGQGANQVLEDAVLLAKWLSPTLSKGNAKERKESELDPAPKRQKKEDSPANKAFLADIGTLSTRLRCYEREMVARTTPKVLESRKAARLLHSPEALTEYYGIEGISREDFARHDVLQLLRANNVNADLGPQLDSTVTRVLGGALSRNYDCKECGENAAT